MATAIDIAREVFPDGNEAFWDYAIWGRTGFPSFWSLKEGQTVDGRLREQLIEFRDGLAACPDGMHLCDFCNRAIASGWVCGSCDWDKHCFDDNEL